MGEDTTDPSYWLNWRFLVSAIYVLGTMVFAAFLIWKYEGGKKVDDERRGHGAIPVGALRKDDIWKTCLRSIHPAFLLAFRIFAFILLLALITGNAIFSGPGVFFYYTQWTFTLTTLYFGVASASSLYGCWSNRDGACHFKFPSEDNNDAEQGSYVSPKLGGSTNTPLLKSLNNGEVVHVRHLAGFMCYLLQVLYQVAAGSVLLTDVVFWLVIYPFMTADHKLAFFDVSMHSVNILILGDAILNCMRFPMFRIAYFILWTGAFVICQWIIHACVSLPWPYPFMDLSPPFSPIWYATVGLLHIPCYGVFALIVKVKHLWLSKYFPESYQGMR